MEIKQYNHKKKPVFMYIHGECLSPNSFNTQIKELKKILKLSYLYWITLLSQ